MPRYNYVYADRNRIKITNKKIWQSLVSGNEDLQDKINNIIIKIGNIGYFDYIHDELPNGITYLYGLYSSYIIDGSSECFTRKNISYFDEKLANPACGFIINVGRDLRIYAVNNYKRKLIIDIRGGNMFIISNKHPTPIVNETMYKYINYILRNYGKNIVNELEALIDIYCEIVDLINQVNTTPVSVKSARSLPTCN